MMFRALRVCRVVGCTALVASGSGSGSSSGYCTAHKRAEVEDIRDKWRNQENKKTPEQRKFYSSARWTTCSREHRIKEPLCRRCRAAGKVTAGTLVHHNPDRNTLIASGLSPYDEKFLETLCFPCHQKELREI